MPRRKGALEKSAHAGEEPALIHGRFWDHPMLPSVISAYSVSDEHPEKIRDAAAAAEDPVVKKGLLERAQFVEDELTQLTQEFGRIAVSAIGSGDAGFFQDLAKLVEHVVGGRPCDSARHLLARKYDAALKRLGRPPTLNELKSDEAFARTDRAQFARMCKDLRLDLMPAKLLEAVLRVAGRLQREHGTVKVSDLRRALSRYASAKELLTLPIEAFIGFCQDVGVLPRAEDDLRQ